MFKRLPFQNAVVAAESMGIGSCYIGDILENFEQIQELFMELASFSDAFS